MSKGRTSDPEGSVVKIPKKKVIHVSRATLEDLDAIVAIEQASFQSPWSRNMIVGEITGNPFSTFCLGRLGPGKEVLGYICYWAVFEELRILNLAVHPSFRGRGYGGTLVAHALSDGKERGANRANLEVRRSNSSGHRLYRTFGFQEVGIRRNYYKDPVEDAILMELDYLGKVNFPLAAT